MKLAPDEPCHNLYNNDLMYNLFMELLMSNNSHLNTTAKTKKKINEVLNKLKNAENISNTYKEIFKLRLKISDEELKKLLVFILEQDAFESKERTISEQDYDECLNILIKGLVGREKSLAHATTACEMWLINLKNNSHQPEEEYLENLRTIHAGYIQRFISDNERIWNTGAIILPISLAGFAAYASMENRSLFGLILIGITSTVLIWSWVIIAENQRSFQNKSMIWINAIERVMKINLFNISKFSENNDILSNKFTQPGGIRFVRIQLPIITTIAWIVIYFYEYLGFTLVFSFFWGGIIYVLFDTIFTRAWELPIEKWVLILIRILILISILFILYFNLEQVLRMIIQFIN